MRYLISFAVFLFLSLSLSAQTKGSRYIDVVFLYRGSSVEGNIITYEYEKRVVIVRSDGDVKEIPWKDVKRVNFRYDKRRARRTDKPENNASEEVEEEFVLETPRRNFRHQVTGALTFGQTFNDRNRFGSSTAIGGGLAYHLLRDVSFLTLGAGLDLHLMNHVRREHVIATTVQAEVPIGRGRWRPFIRMETGPTFPFGGGDSGDEITSRSVTLLYHPAVGVEITPRNGGWGKMTLDLGYRFLNSRFSLTTINLDVVERNVNYRRFTLRGGMRF